MYCQSCGVEVSDSFRYCPQCGTATLANRLNPGASRAERAFRRTVEGKKIAGVCAGIARYLGMDVTLVRVLMLVFALWPPCLGLIFYLVCWIVMPRDPWVPPHLQPQRPSSDVPVTP